MNQKFSIGDFIFDCFICFWLMILSIVVLIKPLYYIYDLFGKPGGLGLFRYDVYDMALEFSILSLVMPTILFYLNKKQVIKYKINKYSFYCVFVLLTICWWLLAYGFVNRDGIK